MRIIIFVFILSMLYSVSFAQSEPCIFCHYGGVLARQMSGINFTFSIDDVPARCQAIDYGATYFNSQPNEDDAKAISELKAAGKTVYMLYMFPEDVDWPCIISSTDETVLDNHIAPMLTYLIENNIDGVILGYLELFKGVIPDYATKISRLMSKIKNSVPNIKIGLFVTTDDPTVYGSSDIFDFAVVDCFVDIYFIDTSLKNLCDETTVAANGGRLPLTSTDPNDTRFSVDTFGLNAFNTGMDKNKLYISLNGAVSKMVPNNFDDYTSYSKYCSITVSESDVYCLDTMQQFYDAAQYSKKYFKGILINGLDFDDSDNSCCCGLFPVTNTYIDAWTDEPLKCCDEI